MREVKTFDELEKPINLTVKTRCPEKYLLIDRENGDIFVGNFMGHWARLESVTKNT